MMASARLQIAVGVVMMVLLVALVIGLVLLGNRGLGRGFVIYVDFDRVESLKEGAEVRISALRVGRVVAVRRGLARGEPPARARVRTQLWLERARAHFVRQTSVVTINSRGPIGERHLEVGPSPGEPGPPVRPGEVLRGIDGPMMDRLIQKGFDTLRTVRGLLAELDPELQELQAASDAVRTRLEELAAPRRLAAIKAAAGPLLEDAGGLWQAVQAAGTDRASATARLDRAISALADTEGQRLAAIASRLGPLSSQLDGLGDLLGPGAQARAEHSFARLRRALSEGEQALALLLQLRARVVAGRGTLGRMLADEELADEIKEAHRQLKEAPWRALGRTRKQRPPAAPARRPP